MELAGKVAIVSGGSRGIGKAISVALAKVGSDIAIVYRDRDDVAAQTTIEEIRAVGRRGVAYRGNVADYDNVVKIVSEVISHFGHIDILVNNAGRASSIDFVRDVKLKEWHNVLDVNLNGVFYFSKSVLDHMRGRKTGCIINISSVIGSDYGSHAGSSSYAVSKAGMNALTRVLAREEARNGIRVNSVAPGYIKTEILDEILKIQGPQREREFLEAIPLARFGQPEEVAELVVFLVSDRSNYITGQNIHLNGGMYYIKSI